MAAGKAGEAAAAGRRAGWAQGRNAAACTVAICFSIIVQVLGGRPIAKWLYPLGADGAAASRSLNRSRGPPLHIARASHAAGQFWIVARLSAVRWVGRQPTQPARVLPSPPAFPFPACAAARACSAMPQRRQGAAQPPTRRSRRQRPRAAARAGCPPPPAALLLLLPG